MGENMTFWYIIIPNHLG